MADKKINNNKVTENNATSNVVSEKNPKIVANNVLASKLSETLKVDTDSYYTTLPSGVEISQKKYAFINPVGKRDSVTVYDATVMESMDRISAYMKGKEYLSYGICVEFANIQNSGKLESMGFKSIAEFGKALYNLESSTVNHYTKIGNCFLNPDYSVKAGLPEISVSHFIELNTLVGENGEIDNIIELFVNGTLSDGLSTKKYREIVKTIKNGGLLTDNSANNAEIDDNKTEETDNTANSTANEDKSSNSQPTIHNLEKSFDIQVAIGQILSNSKAISEICEIIAKNGHNSGNIAKAVEKVVEEAQKLL